MARGQVGVGQETGSELIHQVCFLLLGNTARNLHDLYSFDSLLSFLLVKLFLKRCVFYAIKHSQHLEHFLYFFQGN